MPTELRHVYRALLRAATYLPDSAARTYMHSHVVYRFRSVSDKIKFRSKHNPRSAQGLIEEYHSPKRIAKARQQARQLERAGHGSWPDLKKVLFLTYGRMGRRKRELIEDLLQPEENKLPKDDKALEQLIQGQSEEKPLRFASNSKFLKFVKSQQANQPPEAARFKIRTSMPRIPEENLWGRPVPLKLQESIKRRHWASTLDKLLPPLPEHEWNRLRDLATGAIRIEDPPPRRSRSERKPLAGEENDAKVLEYFTKPANILTSDFDEVKVDPAHGATCWTKPIREVEVPNKNAYTGTPRFMRRLYASIWNMSAKMAQDPVTKEWVIKWGGLRSAFHSGHVITPTTPKDMELFEGVDTNEPPPRRKQGRKRPSSPEAEEDTQAMVAAA
jgi:hypothetical protein